jgi:hypothetical protein
MDSRQGELDTILRSDRNYRCSFSPLISGSTPHSHTIFLNFAFFFQFFNPGFLLRGREVLCDCDWTIFGSDSSRHIISAHQRATALTDRTSPKSGPLQEACRIFHHQTGSTSTWRLSSVRNPSPHSISCANICNRSSIGNCPTRKLPPAADTVLSGSGEVVWSPLHVISGLDAHHIQIVSQMRAI